MSVTSVGASTSAYAYLQSLLSPSVANAGNAAVAPGPVTELLQAFYPSGANGPLTADAATTGGANAAASTASTAGTPGFSPGTMASLISVQGEPWSGGSIVDRAQSLFQQFDGNGDGQISQSEFEGAFGANADLSKVDGLFNALDANGDGSVSQDELTAAAQQSQAHHHHHHHMHGAESGGGGGLAGLLSSTDLNGATSQTASNPDGSSSTTISYADGSTVTMTTPATSNPGSPDASLTGASANSRNLLEQLISLQAQLLTPTDNSVLATA
jgi:hypothetical protein